MLWAMFSCPNDSCFYKKEKKKRKEKEGTLDTIRFIIQDNLRIQRKCDEIKKCQYLPEDRQIMDYTGQYDLTPVGTSDFHASDM